MDKPYAATIALDTLGNALVAGDFRLYAPNGEQLRLVDFFRLADGANLAIVQRRSANANGLLIARTAQNPRYYGTSLLIGITGPAEWPVALALNDGSVVIAEVVGSGQSRTAKLRRMFANSSFDVTWGPDQAYALGINLTVTALAHDELGRLLVAGTDGNGGFVRRYDLTLRPDFVKTFAQEFYNSGLKHYFVTAEQPEVQAILRGAAGPDWTQTFRGFRVYPISPNPPPDSKPVCRFYGNRTIDPLSGKPYGPNSHVFVLDGAECEAVKFDVGWAYEGIAYYIHEPVNGSCAFWQTPVYRVYNNRAGQNDSNHRFVTSTSLYAQMTSQGWKGEGIVMCAP